MPNRRIGLYLLQIVRCYREIAVDQTEQIFEPVERLFVGAVIRQVLAQRSPQEFEDMVVQRRELALAAGQEFLLESTVKDP